MIVDRGRYHLSLFHVPYEYIEHGFVDSQKIMVEV